MTQAELAEIESRNATARVYMRGATAAGVKPFIEGDDVRVVLDTVDALLAEVRRLTPAGKVARWGKGGVGHFGATVLRAGNNRTIARYYWRPYERGPWRARVGRADIGTDFLTEPEARAHIEAWAASKGWEVRDV